jgi:ADP-heptose:LPS heptosyltransferase
MFASRMSGSRGTASGIFFNIDETSLNQATALMNDCNAMLTNDNALMHLSIALDIPAVSIFGPAGPASRVPTGSLHRAAKLGLPCSPCSERKGFLYRKGECMDEIPWEAEYGEVVLVLKTGQDMTAGKESCVL